MVGEEIGQTVIDQIDEDHQGVFFVHLNYVEDDRCENVKTLTVANRSIVTSKGKQNAMETRSIITVVVRRPMATGSMEILTHGMRGSTLSRAARTDFEDLLIELLVVGIGGFVERIVPSFAPIQLDLMEMILCQGDPELNNERHSSPSSRGSQLLSLALLALSHRAFVWTPSTSLSTVGTPADRKELERHRRLSIEDGKETSIEYLLISVLLPENDAHKQLGDVSMRGPIVIGWDLAKIGKGKSTESSSRSLSTSQVDEERAY